MPQNSAIASVRAALGALSRRMSSSRAAAHASGSRRTLAWLLGVILAALAFHVSATGLFWSLHFHPDEHLVASWIDEVRDEGYIHSRAYPSGWFELFRIKFWLEEMTARRGRKWREHAVQDGTVDALFKPTYAPGFGYEWQKEKRRHTVEDGRVFNFVLHLLAVMLMYAACLEAGLHPAAGLVSSLFFLFNANALEFMHYCETDEALIFSFAFFSWLAARTVRLRSVPLALVSAFAAGFAVSCKFTLAPLLLWTLTAPFATLRPERVSRFPPAIRAIPLVLGCAVAACLGYAAGTPALTSDPDWYFAALERAKLLTYREILINLGGNTSKAAANIFRAVCLKNEIVDSGLLTFAWLAFAWTFWLRRGYRRQLAGTPALVPVFLPFLVFMCPFVRRQETLPLAVGLSFGAGLPLDWWLRNRADTAPAKRPLLARVAACAIAVAGLCAFAFAAARALSANDCFRVRDTRAEAQNWLSATLPAGTPVGFDSYVGQAARGVDCGAIYAGGLPYLYGGGIPTSPLDGKPFGYYLENVGFAGRIAVREPETGRMKTEIGLNLARYHAAAFPLKMWAVADSAVRPTFLQPVAKLVSFEKPRQDALDIPLGYCRPILLLPDGARLYDSWEAPGLGANRATHTVGKRTVVAVSFDSGPRWLVSRILDGNQPVKVVREGLTKDRDDLLAPGGAVAVRLRRGPLEWLVSSAKAFQTLRCRMRGDDQSVVCGSYFARSAADAARELLCGASPRKALEMLSAEKELDEAGRVEAFLAAAATGAAPRPEWIGAARFALAACETWEKAGNVAAAPGAVSLCGVPLSCANDFARVRVKGFPCSPGARFPVYFPPGRYTVTVAISGKAQQGKVPEILFREQKRPFRVGRDANGRMILSADIDVGRGTMLHALGDPGNESLPAFTLDFEAVWSPKGQTLRRARELRKALAAFGGTPSATADNGAAVDAAAK